MKSNGLGFGKATLPLLMSTITADMISPFTGHLSSYFFQHMITCNDQILSKSEFFLLVYICRHGVKQPRNPWYDGPEYITQCGIKKGHNFTYVVLFTAEEGTLWWHAHSDWSRATVHGPIVVLPALGTTYPFPQPYEEHTIVLGTFHLSIKLLNYPCIFEYIHTTENL